MQDTDFEKNLLRCARFAPVWAYRIIGNYEAAIEIAQEACMRAWDRRHTYDDAFNFDGWFYSVVRNCCRGVLRRERVHRRAMGRIYTHEPVETVSIIDRVVAKIDTDTQFREAIKALEDLPEADRSLILTVYLSGASRREIAEGFGITTAALNTRLRRALIRARFIATGETLCPVA